MFVSGSQDAKKPAIGKFECLYSGDREFLMEANYKLQAATRGQAWREGLALRARAEGATAPTTPTTFPGSLPRQGSDREQARSYSGFAEMKERSLCSVRIPSDKLRSYGSV